MFRQMQGSFVGEVSVHLKFNAVATGAPVDVFLKFMKNTEWQI